MPWFWEGMKSPIRTLSRRRPDQPPGVTPGRPVATALPPGATWNPGICPVEALQEDSGAIAVEFDRCVHCMRCQQPEAGVAWAYDYQWARQHTPPLPRPFQHSIHVRIIDAGDCGACLSEVRQLTGPVYSLHRFGIYVTPTPREADVLLAVGPVTAGMKAALREAYQAMPTPKRVVAVGVCALNGGIFADGFAVEGGAARVVPVDVAVGGCPPPPLAILDALQRVIGRGLARSGEVRA